MSAQMKKAETVRTLGSCLGVWDMGGVEQRESSQIGIFVRIFGTTTDSIIPSLPLLLGPPISISAARRNARPAPPVPPRPAATGEVFPSPVVPTHVALPGPVQDAPEALLGSNIIAAAVYPNCAAAVAAMDAIPARLPQTDQLERRFRLRLHDFCWENTDGIQKGAPPSSAPTNGAPPFQCSPESDLDFHVEFNELHIMVCLGRPRQLREHNFGHTHTQKHPSTDLKC